MHEGITNYYKEYKSTYITTAANTTVIPINITQYRNGIDLLSVHINGLQLIEGTDYTKGTNNITLTKAIAANTPVHFIVLRSVAATTADYSKLKGDKGDQGEKGTSGAAATITVGTTTTGAAGTKASVTNVGTTSAAKFNFTIPKGEKGEKGEKGDPGTISDEVMQQIIEAATTAALKTENPVGKIRLQTTNTNPATFLGFGTWVQWGAGRVPVGINTSDKDFKTAEQTGGEKTHTLSLAEMPRHTHEFTYNNSNTCGFNSYAHGTNNYGEQKSDKSLGFNNISYTGGDKAHNNLQPYITCYMWKRVA